MILQFPTLQKTPRTQHSRRRAHCPRSLHTYRRALLRRMGMTCVAGRPAAVFDNLARELLAARV